MRRNRNDWRRRRDEAYARPFAAMELLMLKALGCGALLVLTLAVLT